MQGQRSAIGSLPDSLNFDFGSAPTNVGMDQQQLRWNNLRDSLETTRPSSSDYRIAAPGASDSFIANINQEGPSLSRWNIGDPVSSTSFPNPMNHEERIIQNGWSSMSSSASGPSLRSEEPTPELPSIFSRSSLNLNLNSNQAPSGSSGPSFFRGSNSGSSMQGLDINATLSGFGGAAASGDLMECSDISNKSGGFEPRMVPSSSGPSSEPFASSSGSVGGGFMVEDDNARPGSSMEGRRISCKRKSFEGHSGQSSMSGSCILREGGGGGSIWQAAGPSYNVVGGSSLNPPSSSSSETSLGVRLRDAMDQRLALSMGGTPGNNSLPPTNVGVGAGDNNPARSFRGRLNMSNPQDSYPNHLFVPRVSGSHSSSVSTTHQPSRLVPVTSPMNLMPQIQPDNTASQTVARFHGLRRNVQTVRWSGGASGSRALPPSDPSTAVSERNVSSLHEDRPPRSVPANLSEPPMLIPSSEVRNPSHTPPSWGVNNAHNSAAGMPARSLGSTSRAGSGVGSHSSSGPNWGSHRHVSSQHSHRLSEYIRRSLLAAENGGAPGSSHRPPSQDAHNPGVGHPNLFSRPGILLDRRGDGAAGVPLSLRALAAGGEGRSRIFAEIRNVLDMMRRGETLRVEDVMILDPSVIFGMAEMHDQHRDMRLDVDNMSYEELLALEERIGNVCTGLSEETIMGRMKQRKCVWVGKDNLLEPEPCCICQEDYCLGEDLGTLDCGHDFHTKCIKQWLGQKNLCPICKTTGLAT